MNVYKMKSNLNYTHRTAIKRRALSLPMRFLNENGFLGGLQLDYGCGHGDDAKALNMDRYDPYHWPYKPRHKFDTITCNYVLNTFDRESQFQWFFFNLNKLLKRDGIAYITVRRDIKKEGYTKRNTYQHNVILDLPILHETSTYCIYMYEYNKEKRHV